MERIYSCRFPILSVGVSLHGPPHVLRLRRVDIFRRRRFERNADFDGELSENTTVLFLPSCLACLKAWSARSMSSRGASDSRLRNKVRC